MIRLAIERVSRYEGRYFEIGHSLTDYIADQKAEAEKLFKKPEHKIYAAHWSMVLNRKFRVRYLHRKWKKEECEDLTNEKLLEILLELSTIANNEQAWSEVPPLAKIHYVCQMGKLFVLPEERDRLDTYWDYLGDSLGEDEKIYREVTFVPTKEDLATIDSLLSIIAQYLTISEEEIFQRLEQKLAAPLRSELAGAKKSRGN